MAQAFNERKLPTARADRYREVAAQIASVLDGETNLTARMATVASMLSSSFDHYIWTGFYVVDGKELVVGPYQGTLGCLRIAFGRGVCGTAAA
ncbi:MAG TPA: GAF domain-containing protein, partial [Caulobacteraceae bacterium]|nr:GAF domain-containing protein [Caulobacteraceae bacterium]